MIFAFTPVVATSKFAPMYVEPAMPAPPGQMKAPVVTDELEVVFASLSAPSVPIAAAPFVIALPVVPLKSAT